MLPRFWKPKILEAREEFVSVGVAPVCVRAFLHPDLVSPVAGAPCARGFGTALVVRPLIQQRALELVIVHHALPLLVDVLDPPKLQRGLRHRLLFLVPQLGRSGSHEIRLRQLVGGLVAASKWLLRVDGSA